MNVTVFWVVRKCRLVEIERSLGYITTFVFSISWKNERGLFNVCIFVKGYIATQLRRLQPLCHSECFQ